jgi:ethanolamine utilization microcompartment shell protein EutL
MLGGPNPAEVRAGLDAMVANIESGAAFQWANDAEDTAFLAHVVRVPVRIFPRPRDADWAIRWRIW